MISSKLIKLRSIFKGQDLFKLITERDILVCNRRFSSIDINSRNDKKEFDDDWFKKISAQDQNGTSNNANQSRKKFQDLSKEEKREFILDIWKAGRDQGYFPFLNELTETHIQALEENAGYHSIRKSLLYLSKKEYYKLEKAEEKKIKEKQKLETHAANKKLLDENFKGPLTSYPGHSSFMKIISSSQEKFFYRNKVLSSIRNNSPNIVFDWRYKIDDPTYINSLNRQFIHILNYNNIHSSEPFQLHFCNYNYNSKYNQRFGTKTESGKRQIDYNLIMETEKSYMDLFPKEKLVYLSNDSRVEMKAYDPEKVYIIGVIIDKKDNEFNYASYTQAKKDGIACERLPIESFVKWQAGSKNLNLNHVFEILNKLYHNGNDWEGALIESLPTRKVTDHSSKRR